MKPIICATIVSATLLMPMLGMAQTVPLSSSWNAYDPLNLLTLSAQSASGFTATIVTNSTPTSGNPDIPRIFQTFADLPFTNNATRVQVTFDLVVNDPMVVGDTVFRFGLCNTNYNEDIIVMYDTGTPAGTAIRSRMDVNNGDSGLANGITDNSDLVTIINGWTNVRLYDPTNWNSAFNAGFNLDGGTGGLATLTTKGPNNIGLGISASLATKHSFRYSLERTPAQLLQDCVWNNDAGPALVGVSGTYLDTTLSIYTPPIWQGVNAFGFHIYTPGAFVGESGSYTISNLKITTGFALTSISRDSDSGDVAITWESSPLDSSMGAQYVVEYTTNLTTAVWTSIATNTAASTRPEGYSTSYTNSATTDQAAYYRVQKIYP